MIFRHGAPAIMPKLGCSGSVQEGTRADVCERNVQVDSESYRLRVACLLQEVRMQGAGMNSRCVTRHRSSREVVTYRACVEVNARQPVSLCEF